MRTHNFALGGAWGRGGGGIIFASLHFVWRGVPEFSVFLFQDPCLHHTLMHYSRLLHVTKIAKSDPRTASLILRLPLWRDSVRATFVFLHMNKGRNRCLRVALSPVTEANPAEVSLRAALSLWMSDAIHFTAYNNTEEQK